VDVEKNSRISPEDAARKARYAAFDARMQAGDVLLLAHHADDQAETFLLRALRGAGVPGLAAMPPSRAFSNGMIARPLLDIDRSTLERYATAQKIEYVIDPSNDAIEFDRNFLRHEILSRLRQRWPGVTGRFTAAAQNMAEANVLLRERAREDIGCCNVDQRWGAPTIELAPLLARSPERQRNAVRYFLETAVPDLPIVLSQQQLQQLQQQWFHAREDANPQIDIGTVQLRRYRGRGYIVRPLLSVGVACEWNLQHDIELPGLGHLRVRAGLGGLRNLDKVEVRFRRGGETWCGDGAHHHPLKQWLQENGIPPWLRDLLPLLFYQDELIAIADLAIAKHFRASENETGLHLAFEFFVSQT